MCYSVENLRNWWNGLQINLELRVVTSPYPLTDEGSAANLLPSMAFVIHFMHSLTRLLVSDILGMVTFENGVSWSRSKKRSTSRKDKTKQWLVIKQPLHFVYTWTMYRCWLFRGKCSVEKLNSALKRGGEGEPTPL